MLCLQACLYISPRYQLSFKHFIILSSTKKSKVKALILIQAIKDNRLFPFFPSPSLWVGLCDTSILQSRGHKSQSAMVIFNNGQEFHISLSHLVRKKHLSWYITCLTCTQKIIFIYGTSSGPLSNHMIEKIRYNALKDQCDK